MKRALFLVLLLVPAAAVAGGMKGYYRYPAIHGNTIVFTAEGDLWRIDIGGGIARRLTTHHGMETDASISPDGKLIAFSGQYEGSTDVYTIPIEGGVPGRITWEGAVVTGWTPDGRILYSSRDRSTLPSVQLAAARIDSGEKKIFPLAQAADGSLDDAGKVLFFTRIPFQGSHTKRYRGGTIQHIWKFPLDASEAVPLTEDFPGTSKEPMWWNGRVYFVSDRDGTMNIWSINGDGGGLEQHTFHKGLDVSNPSLQGGRIAYQLIADIFIYDIDTGESRMLDISLASDFDRMRERWVGDPSRYITSAHLSPDGDRIVLTARGQAFVARAKKGRLVQATRKDGVRHRSARFMPDGKTLILLSDESSELEFHTVPANGIGEEKILTGDGKVLRYEGIPSPDGKLVAYTDKDYVLWVLDVGKKSSKRIDTGENANFSDIAWSPDSRWLAYVSRADNLINVIKLYSMEKEEKYDLTGERVDCYDPAWSPDGKWLFFLSDRTFNSLVRSPWGPRQPEPFFDRTTGVYMVPLAGIERSPFLPDDEAYTASGKSEEEGKAGEKSDKGPVVKVAIGIEGIRERIMEVPVPAGNYYGLTMNGEVLFWIDRDISDGRKRALKALKIDNKDIEVKTVAEDIRSYELSLDGKKLMVGKNGGYYVFDASTSGPSSLDKHRVDLSGWTFTIDPRREWRQIFTEAWRLERDYFYDRDLHGVDYERLFGKYLPYVERVTDRFELSDLIAHLVGELSALHTFVVGGDMRNAPENVSLGKLGASLSRDERHKGYRIDHIYRGDPDDLSRVSPLSRQDLGIKEGDVIRSIDGQDVLEAVDISELLKNKVGRQILLSIARGGGSDEYEAIVKPISPGAEFDLRYAEWENGRRLIVEEAGAGDIGYVHLRAMGGDNITEWVKNFYPVFNRKGLIIDVRHNRGGNIDSWILEKLMRRAWFYWKPRVGNPIWNMQYAFRGHMVVLCNEYTASDGEAFTEGFRRLGLGKVIGTRTWGGEIWLSFNNFLVDRGIASAGELGVYGPEGEWLIEGHGVEPDIVVDNLPHETYLGKDTQLEAAIRHLQEMIESDPVEVPETPDYPDKSFKY